MCMYIHINKCIYICTNTCIYIYIHTYSDVCIHLSCTNTFRKLLLAVVSWTPYYNDMIHQYRHTAC